MKDFEQKKAAKEFAERWKDKGYEKGESQKYWMELLQKVFGIEDPFSFVEFEDRVKTDDQTTDFIDVVIPSTKILIEQKSIEVDLDKAVKQSDGQLLTPYGQARKYYNNLPKSKLPDYIITCNFKQFNIYDMEKPNGEPERIFLDELDSDYYRLMFIVNSKSELLMKEEKVSKDAGDLIGEIYDAFAEELDMENEENQRIVNILCVRLVFCLYAEDSQLFNKNLFYDYIRSSDVNHIQNDLYDLFKVLNTKERDSFTRRDLLDFPFVNGGLFNEEVKIPYFTDKIYNILINKACKFNWSEISPTIFGGIFESTLNPETRRNNGMHYTSVENIHKVIDPLFLNDLKDEFFEIKSVRVRKDKKRQLLEFQNKLSRLKFFDPACGSGNFLTESYRCLRELENDIIRELVKLEGKAEGQITFGTNVEFDPIKVHIQQFYGIEINDFAVSVARTALWIQEAQMFSETQSIVVNNSKLSNFLPLDSYDNIHECNALRTDWNTIISKNECSYIMGNPPFVGTKLMNDVQREDRKIVFNSDEYGKLDYVSCWYKKVADYIQLTRIKAALVSTNSICQGEQVSLLWKELFNHGLTINFCHRTFRWDSEANIKAHVHCIIVGFSYVNNAERYIYDHDIIIKAKNINGYLIDAPNIFIEKTQKSLFGAPEMVKGSQLIDDGNYIFTEDEMNKFISRWPESKDYFYRYMNADKFLNDRDSMFCLCLKNCPPDVIKKCPGILERVQKVYEYRNNSTAESTHKLKDRPQEFFITNIPNGNSMLFPVVSSEKRKYIPIGFIKENVIYTNATNYVDNASLYDFGIFTSNVHMSWVKVICGRLKSDYRYSKDLVYNTFPLPNPTMEQREKIGKTAKMILDAREKYSNNSLADLYGETMYLYPELLKAHQENDKAVMDAYGFDWRKMKESECVSKLMKMYQELTKKEK